MILSDARSALYNHVSLPLTSLNRYNPWLCIQLVPVSVFWHVMLSACRCEMNLLWLPKLSIMSQTITCLREIGVVNAELLYMIERQKKKIRQSRHCTYPSQRLTPAVGEQWVHVHTLLPNSTDPSSPINIAIVAQRENNSVSMPHSTSSKSSWWLNII